MIESKYKLDFPVRTQSWNNLKSEPKPHLSLLCTQNRLLHQKVLFLKLISRADHAYEDTQENRFYYRNIFI